MRLANGRPGFLQKEREECSDYNRGDIDAAGRHEQILRSATGAMNFLVFVMIALAGPGIGWWMQKLARGAGAALRLAVASRSIVIEAGSVNHD